MQFSAPIFRLKRQAKQLARDQGIPLHQALDRIAVGEGFGRWSLLAAQAKATSPASRIMEKFLPGELILLAARPQHGKTVFGLELLVAAVKTGRQSACFSLDYTADDLTHRIADIDPDLNLPNANLLLDTSDDICAEHIMAMLAQAKPQTMILVDYLQLLDQKRAHPPLAQQVLDLQRFAQRTQVIMVFISQIDRRYDPQGGMPGVDDLRLPNVLDLSVFSKGVFLHDGEVRVDTLKSGGA